MEIWKWHETFYFFFFLLSHLKTMWAAAVRQQHFYGFLVTS